MKTTIIIALIAFSMLLPICFAQMTKPEDLSTFCSYIGNKYNRYIQQNSDSFQRCTYCQYKYNDPSDPVFGGCASCPNFKDGSCTSCVSGYVLFNGKCVSCGNGVKSCTIANQNFLKDPVIQQVLSDISNSTLKTQQQKNIEEMKIYQQYLAIRADECVDSSSSDGVVAEIGSVCKKIQNCDKIDRTSTTVSCSKCKAGFYFDSHFSCTEQCKADIVFFNNDKYEKQESKVCSDCTYKGLCKTCPAGTVQVSSKNQDALKDSTLMVCQKCMDNCQQCSVSDSLTSHIQCDICSSGFFYNSDKNTCDQCNIDSLLINKPSDSQRSSIKLVCSGNSFNQINWSASYVTQNDLLNQTFTYSIKTVNNNQAFICGEGAIDCELKDGNVINKTCLYGYALKDNKCVSCDTLAKNSILCQYNDKLNAYIPTLCKVGSQFDIPYADSYSLQITIDEVDGLVKEGIVKSYSDVPNPDTWCQINTKQCKSFASLRQKIALNISDDKFKGACNDCFTDDSIPKLQRKISSQDFYQFDDGQTQKCLRCSDQNAVSCKQIDNQIQTIQCSSHYYLSVNNECLPIKSEDQIKQIDNCLSQKQNKNNDGSDSQLCVVCAENYHLSNDNSACQPNSIENCAEQEDTTCKRCIQDGKQYYLKDNKCISIPQGCASYQNGNCSVCQYSYKPVNITDVQVCIPCYQEFNNAQALIQYDCPGKVKKSQLENDDGLSVQPKSNSMVLLFSAIYFILFLVF
ncbi:transmembrane protein, putative (macronuclear) [Tetrahymena thermophila SB210]|uniref:Transmembrane protein, putative n=1 Tax=Tetrahymena thermophila (strain SB210) TaxID=312017 RepID=Q232G7_TETTS|nr:transmembrane protein, putative [Tetrahymena thermophila SB210]EAR91445.1 transmembrane protein, putative [Tetrahymena thermophila SB210]|eukprot:XP_001011690.1 transmembrane protein, putative [Tetrahymena thermophila SB210]